MLRRLLPVAAVLALAACSGPRELSRPGGGDDPLATRRTALATQGSWSFEGRVAVSDGRDSGSARISWTQDGDRYRIILRAPVSGETWRLVGDSTGCRLEGLRPEPVVGADPEELLRRELGWNLPVRAMTSWARGVSGDAARAEVALDADGLPGLVVESGWRVQFRDWHREGAIALPKRIEAERPPHVVRLAIASWSGDVDPGG